MRRILTWAFLSQLVFSPSAAIANWPSQPGVNLAIAVGPESQAPGAIVSDLAGGAIISWTSSPYFGGQGILAQRTDRLGRLLWASAGVPLSAAVGRASYPAAVSDGAGGAIVGWIVMPPQIVPTTIRLQRIGADGQVLWGVDGIEIPASDNVDFASLVMVPDGAGGAILAWEGARAGIRNPVILRRESMPPDLCSGTPQPWPSRRGTFIARIL